MNNVEERLDFLEYFIFGLAQQTDSLHRIPELIKKRYGSEPILESWLFQLMSEVSSLRAELLWFRTFVTFLREEGILPDWLIDSITVRCSIEELEKKKITKTDRLGRLRQLNANAMYLKALEKQINIIDDEIKKKSHMLNLYSEKLEELRKVI